MNDDNFVLRIYQVIYSNTYSLDPTKVRVLRKVAECCTKTIILDDETTANVCFVCDTPIRKLSSMPYHFKLEHSELLTSDVFGARYFGYSCSLCDCISSTREQLALHFESDSHLRALNADFPEKREERMEARTNARLNKEWLSRHELVSTYAKGRVRNYKKSVSDKLDVAEELDVPCKKRNRDHETSSSTVSKLSHSFSLTMLNYEFE